MNKLSEESFRKVFRYDKDLKVCSSSLVKILDEKPIWKGFYGEVSEVLIDYKGKKLRFARKSFETANDVCISLLRYQSIKDAKIPTWNTYRGITWAHEVLMTLGNADGSLIFSPHNESKDRKKAKSDQIFETLGDKEAFFEQAWEILTKSAEQNLLLPWDSYFLKWKEGNLSLIIGDFDQVCVWKNEIILKDKIEDNIKEFFGLLSGMFKYFWADDEEKFLLFLQKKQENRSPYLTGIDLPSLYRWCSFIWK